MLARVRTRRWFGGLARAPLLAFRMGLGPVVGLRFMVLTTRGRKSGAPRHTMVAHVRVGPRLYAAAAYGPRSHWYRNLLAHPIATVQTARGASSVGARRVTSEEELRTVLDAARRRGLLRALLASQGVAGGVEEGLAARERLYLIAFEPAAEAGPPGLRADLAWLWPAAVAAVVAARLRRGRARASGARPAPADRRRARCRGA